MTRSALTEQVQQVERLESELLLARKKAARSIRKVRTECGLSLRQVQPLVNLTPSAILSLERGRSWQTETARRVARVLDERCA